MWLRGSNICMRLTKKYIYTYYNGKMSESDSSPSSSDNSEHLDYVLVDKDEGFVYKLSRIQNVPHFPLSDSDSNVFEPNTSDSDDSAISTSEDISYDSESVETNIYIFGANKNDIFKELIQNQITNLQSEWKLNINDMKRICKYIHSSIFDPEKCCIWNGYITNINNKNKGTYVNFYFKNKKVALHRLLYSNFVNQLATDEYIKFNCENKGICCNVHHYKKYKYIKNNSPVMKKPQPTAKKSDMINMICENDPKNLILDFD